MAYVNVKDWSVEQVTDWLKGLDNVILPYIKSFLNNGVNGHQLLNLRVDDLEHLGVCTLGHQEIILESVEHIRNFHYELDKENLQMLALRLSCASNSLNRELQFADEDAKMVQTQTMSDVHNIISTIKPLVCWLDRSPFAGDRDYNEIKRTLLELGFEMATSAHRDIFSEKPIRSIRDICEKLTKLADTVIQEISDPMILQPATLDLTTLKKKEQELGFFILPSNSAIHQIAEIKYGSPAHLSTKIEEGDEIVQVNYQTVVGWQRKKVTLLLQESPPEIVLTLKKRPRHTKVYGQIYMKPYRLPSKKRAAPYSRWNENLPSPRLLAIHDLPQITLPKTPVIVAACNDLDSETSSSGDSDDSETPDSPLTLTLENGGCIRRLYPLKPRSVLQRRNTITGATPSSSTNTTPRTSHALEQYWKRLKNQATTSSSYNLPTIEKFNDESSFIRDKSASCSHGLELTQRPTTVIGLAGRKNSFKTNFGDNKTTATTNGKKIVNFDERNIIINDTKLSITKECSGGGGVDLSLSTTSLSSLKDEIIEFIDEGDELQDRSKMTIEQQQQQQSNVVVETKDDAKSSLDTMNNNNNNNNNVIIRDNALNAVNVDNIIKKFEECDVLTTTTTITTTPKILPRQLNNINSSSSSSSNKPTIQPRNLTKLRGKLDKSYSTPAYDLSSMDETNELFISSNNAKIEEAATITTTTTTTTTTLAAAVVDKYELGIPLLADVPPKPPPRTHIPEQYKRNNNNNKPPIIISSNDQETIENDNAAMMMMMNMMKKTDFDNNIQFEANNITSSSSTPTSTISTPIVLKQFTTKDDSMLRVDTTQHAAMTKKTSPTTTTSSTNLVVRAICSTKKAAAAKKKNSLIAKKRKVSVNDVSPGEMQGYLQQRLRSKHNQNVHWERRWFVLNQHCLYGFKTKEASKAECYIYLTGFTVTVANEVKSRANAFKVYHTGTVFYFSTECEELLATWLEMIQAATFNSDPQQTTTSSTNDTIQYSETDDDSDNDTTTTTTTTTKSTTSEKSTLNDSLKKFNSLKKFASSSSKKRNETSSTSSPSGGVSSGSTSLDRKWFFNKSTTNVQTSTPSPPPPCVNISKHTLPVPTAQFRSYRKIPTSTTIGNFTSHIPNFANKVELPTLQLPQQQQQQSTNSSHLSIVDSLLQQQENVIDSTPTSSTTTSSSKAKLQINHLHASNPTLCNMELNPFHHTFHLAARPRNDNSNFTGFLTLEELMNRESDERRHISNADDDAAVINSNLICPDVVYGEVPIRAATTTSNNKKKTHLRTSSDCSDTKKESSCFGKRSSSIKNSSSSSSSSTGTTKMKINASLPRTPKHHHHHHQGDSSSMSLSHKLKSNSSKSLVMVNRSGKDSASSYEMIYCPQKTQTADVQFAQNRTLDGRMYHQQQQQDKKQLKAAMQYTPMTLPLTSDEKLKLSPQYSFELNLDEKAAATSAAATHKSGKFKHFFMKHGGGGDHYHTTSGSSSSSSNKKEKKSSTSPKSSHHLTNKNFSSLDHGDDEWHNPDMLPHSSSESFAPYLLPTMEQRISPPSLLVPADYPGLEYPPVFEPETYSLANPQATFFRKQTKN